MDLWMLINRWRRLTHNREESADTLFGWLSRRTATGFLLDSQFQPDRPELKELLNKIWIRFPHQLWREGFDHTLEVCIIFFIWSLEVVQIDQHCQLLDHGPSGKIVGLEKQSSTRSYFLPLSYPILCPATFANVKSALSIASSVIFLASPGWSIFEDGTLKESILVWLPEF